MRTHFPNICISCVLFVLMFCFFPTSAVFIYFPALEKRSATAREAHLKLLPAGRRPSELSSPGKNGTVALVQSRSYSSPAHPTDGCCGFTSQDCFVTKRASRECHLDTTCLKLAPVPWQPARQPGDGNKLHHLVNMRLARCRLKDRD